MARDKSGLRNFGDEDSAVETGTISQPDLTSGGDAQAKAETEAAIEAAHASDTVEAASTEALFEDLNKPDLFHVTVSGEGGPYYLAGRTPAARAQLTTEREKALTFSAEEAEKHAEGLRQPQDWNVDVVPADR